MHVLVVIGFYPPDHSGAGLRILRSYTALAQAHELKFDVLAEPLRNPQPDLPNVTRLSSATFAPLLAVKVAATLLNRRGKTDLVHCIGPTRLTVMAAFFCRLFRIPYISEVSLDYDDAHKNFIERALLKSFFQPDAAIALTPRIAQMFKTANIYQRPNPVMLENTASAADRPLLEKVDSMPQSKKHLVLGRFCDRKNQLAAIELLDNLPEDHGLVLAGPVIGDEDYWQEVQAKTSDRVVLWPHAVENPAALYKATTSLWCLSKLEGLPNVVLEALWSGRPCFVNQELGLGNWLIHRGNGAEIGNAETLLQFFETGYDAGAIAAEARKKFDPAAINGQTYKLFQAVARGQI